LSALASRSQVDSAGESRQRPFAVVVPLLIAALLLGVCGGFALAATLTLTRALNAGLGLWWPALAQAHGHLQLYGWAGLFVLGVALHFVPRLRGTPLVGARYVPLIVAAQVASLALRAVSQPLVSTNLGVGLWRVLLVASGALECAAHGTALLLLGATLARGPALERRTALRGVLPLFLLAFTALAAATLANLVNVTLAATSATALVPAGMDALNVRLGLDGFLVPVALAMSAQALPMYAGLAAFPRRILWPLAGVYGLGLLLACVGDGAVGSSLAGRLSGAGRMLLGGSLVYFIAVFLRKMRQRGHMPGNIAALAARPDRLALAYQEHVAAQRKAYGPFVALIAAAYLWALLGGILLLLDGGATLLDLGTPVPVDAIRHSLAVGFIALLLSGIAPRMLPGFSGGRIASPSWVTATLWLGNAAAALRVGSILAQPLQAPSSVGAQLTAVAFGLSGPVGLALAVALAINLWPAILPRSPDASGQT
jgi:uncharacterized protein involved in response to NO